MTLPTAPSEAVERRVVALQDVNLEVFIGGPDSSNELPVCAAHPADGFGPPTVELLAGVARARVVCINPRGFGGAEASALPSLEEMVDRIEGVRRSLGVEPWIFWGMSGGGWLAQIYAHRHPESLAGMVVESACLCFRERLADPACVLSPFFPPRREALRAAGLLSEGSHREPSPGEETEWVDVAGVGQVFRRRDGPALLVSPAPLEPGMKSIMPRLWTFDSRAWIGTVRVPALVLCGTADPVVPVNHARAVHEAIAGSVFVAIKDAGHVPVVQKPPEVAKAFQSFVSRLGAGRRRAFRETERVLLAVDLAGYSRATASVNALAIAVFLDDWYRQCAHAVRKRGGRVVKYMGDACLATFPGDRCVDAIDTAIELRDGIEEVRSKHQLMVELGANVHLAVVAEGEFGPDDDRRYDILGSGVNHLFMMGGGAGIRISDRVYRQLSSDRQGDWEGDAYQATYALARAR